MIEVYDPLCVTIILEKKNLTRELEQLTTERITLTEDNLEENQGTHKSYIDNLKQYFVFEFSDYVI